MSHLGTECHHDHNDSASFCVSPQVTVTMYEILAQPAYDLFFLLGNEKYPMYKGLGRMNVSVFGHAHHP
jgi:hypothetical protein